MREIDVLESEYVLFARARGESEFSILRRHGLRNIILPALTLQFASFAELFGGSVIAENVLAIILPTATKSVENNVIPKRSGTSEFNPAAATADPRPG